MTAEEERVLTPGVFILGIVLSVILSLMTVTFPVFLIPGNMLKLGDLVGPLNTGIPSMALAFGLVVFVGALLSKAKIDPKK